jgi:iron complex transport system substrate-binding protein
VACPGVPSPRPAHLRPPGSGRFSLAALRRTRTVVLSALALLGACTGRDVPRSGAPIVAVDDAGDTVRLAAPAARIASLIPATTELLFAVGLGDRVVGRTAWGDYPPAAIRVPSLGDGLQPNLEAIVAARPDLVLLYNSTQNASAAARLSAQGIATLLVNTDRLEDVPRLARLLASLGGRPEAGDSVARAFESQLTEASVPPRSPPVTLLLLAWDQPPIVIGAGSFLNELIERAGAHNAFADVAAASAPVSLEAIAARPVDAVLVIGDSLPAFARKPEWQAVPAVRDHRFIFVPANLFSRPGPRSPAALRALRAALDAGPRR